MKKRLTALIVMVVMVFSFSITSFAVPSVTADTKKELLRYVLFSVINHSVENKEPTELFLDTLMKYAGDDDEKFNEIMRCFTESIDEYGEYYSPEEVAAFSANLTGVSGGIGATVEMVNGIFSIVNVLPGSASEAAGVQAGWQIVTVDGEPMEGKSLYGALSYVRGDIGSGVVIEFLTPDKKSVTLTLVRGHIDIASLSYVILEKTKNKIGYITIENFAETTGAELRAALEEMKADGIKKIILDLRYNGGGVLDGALEVASCFLKKDKVIVTIEPKNEKDKEVYKSTGSVYNGELVVLVNEHSASASEVVTAALKEHGRAQIVGVKTFGKASVQNVMSLPFYGGLYKFTTAYYTTPSGESIDKKGISPDYIVPIEEFQLHPKEIDALKLERKFDLNDSGEDVKVVKKFLTQIGYRLSEDDVYDELTKKVVQSFQKEKGLYPYGICDFTTQKAIRDTLLEKVFYKDTQLEKAIELLDK